MNALAEFGILVRHKIRLNALICCRPRFTAVGRSVNARGGDRDLQIVRVLFVGDDRVQTEAAKSGSPILAVLVFPEAAVEFPGFASIVRFEKPARSRTDVKRIVIRTRSDLPDILERGFRIRGHLDTPLFGHIPRLAHIGALAKLSTKMPARRTGPHLVSAFSLIEKRRIYREPSKMRPFDRPFIAARRPLENEQPFAVPTNSKVPFSAINLSVI
ncbi:MAG: hypothetical protein IPG67_10720 [Acidobacteria bacterium]|nr:hypothetical protein [Acidobacteriota bacterium]